MKKFIEWFLTPSIEPISETDNLYSKLIELEDRISKLEEENISTTNELYRLENSLDARIDILAEHCRINKDV